MVEVGYTSTSSADAEDPFLGEESDLLDNVARQLSLYVTRQEGAARRALLEEQLRHADRLATIGQLAAGVAHEMNEPLSSVLGLAQLALKVPGTPQSVVDDLHGIVAASLRAREIVKKLLLFARQTPPRKSPVNLNEIVEEALFLLEAGCERQGIRLLRHLASDLPTVEADAIQVRQVLVNLTVNAMQAIAAEGTVTVETRSEAAHVVLSVTDSGHGMSPETMNKVFNPFFTTKDPGEGTGLGLSVVHGIVTSHGGTIEVESRKGGGSRFIVRLPATQNTGAHG
jgi:signal transduction histidine kinase